MPLCDTCGYDLIFVGEYTLNCENPCCPDYKIVFEYGGEDYPVQLADARQSSFQWDHSESHENILEHSQE